MDRENRYPINIVARRTGISPHVIRIWERRYSAVLPQRSPTNRRLYSEADIERFTLLRKAIDLGHSIGHVAKLPTERLRQLIALEGAPARTAAAASEQPAQLTALHSSGPALDNVHVEACLAAVRRLDAVDLERAIARAVVALSRPALIDQVLVPLIHEVGEQWRVGTLRAVHEHLLTAAIRSFWSTIRSPQEALPSAPNIVITTPAGQIHELGAMLAAVTASGMGWRTTYLGPNLPAEEIAAALEYNQAQIVALSIVYPDDDPLLEYELRRLRHYLHPSIAIVVGGRAAPSYHCVLDEIGAERICALADFRERLAGFRRQSGAALPPAE